jgi:hypothetical protein
MRFWGKDFSCVTKCNLWLCDKIEGKVWHLKGSLPFWATQAQTQTQNGQKLPSRQSRASQSSFWIRRNSDNHRQSFVFQNLTTSEATGLIGNWSFCPQRPFRAVTARPFRLLESPLLWHLNGRAANGRRDNPCTSRSLPWSKSVHGRTRDQSPRLNNWLGVSNHTYFPRWQFFR